MQNVARQFAGSFDAFGPVLLHSSGCQAYHELRSIGRLDLITVQWQCT